MAATVRSGSESRDRFFYSRSSGRWKPVLVRGAISGTTGCVAIGFRIIQTKRNTAKHQSVCAARRAPFCVEDAVCSRAALVFVIPTVHDRTRVECSSKARNKKTCSCNREGKCVRVYVHLSPPSCLVWIACLQMVSPRLRLGAGRGAERHSFRQVRQGQQRPRGVSHSNGTSLYLFKKLADR